MKVYFFEINDRLVLQMQSVGEELSGDSWCFLDNMQLDDDRQLQEILNKLGRKEKE